jgi:HYR domain
VDTTPPVILCPADKTVVATSTNGAIVTFSASASDRCDPNPVVTCVPPSGSYFPVGTNTVICSAVDASGNTNSCSFSVNVLPQQTPNMINVAITNGVVLVRFSGMSSNHYQVWRSTNLSTWTLLTNVTLPADGAYTFRDSSPPTSRAFYRATWLP